MLNTVQILDELKMAFAPSQAESLAMLADKLYMEIANTLIKEGFQELREIVRVLSERIDRLAEAQSKTEQAVDSFKRTSEENFNRVWKVIVELTEAQKRTEERINELAEAQAKTEQSLESFKKTTEENFSRVWKAIDELTEAQKKTEEELKRLVGEHKKTREHLGTLSHTVGYVLEDRAYKGLVGLLKRDFSLEVIEGLRRDYIEVGIDKYEEVNIIGRARVNGKEVWVIGECKSQLKKGDVDEFLRSVKRIEPYVSGEKVIVAVTYQAPPPVRKYVEQKGIKLYFSYELPL
jgi:prefoldin subunit 5